MSSDIQPITKKVGDLDFTFQPGSGKVPSKGKLTVSSDGKTIKVDSFDIVKESSRNDFIDGMLKAHPDLVSTDSKGDISSCLLDFAAMEWKPIDATTQDDNSTEIVKVEDSPIYREAYEMLKSDDLFEQISKDIETIGVVGERKLAKTCYLVMTSRLLNKPLSSIIQGLSSTGKSYTLDKDAKLMPPEAILMAHEISDQALYYMKPGSLVHKVVVAGERCHNKKAGNGQAEENSKAFREMIASGFLSKLVTVKEKGKWVTREIKQDGPIAYLESTTATQLFDEDSTRLLKLATDETCEQTQNIMEGQKQEAKLLTANEQNIEKIVQRHHALQRILAQLGTPVEIRIPFIDKINLPTTNVSSRRTFPFLISFIRVVALLRQFHPSKKQRDSAEGEDFIIEADMEDYRIAYELIQPIMTEMYAPIPSKSLDIIPVIKEKSGKTNLEGTPYIVNFTAAECEDWTDLSNATVYRRLWPLVKAGILSVDKDAQPYKFRLINKNIDATKLKVALDLPLPEELSDDLTLCGGVSNE